MSYTNMAVLYDHLMKGAPYSDWLTFTKAIFQKSGKEINNIVDLGCGTGEITIPLAKDGYHMTGIDYSSDMLTYAERKANDENISIRWIQQDLRELEGFNNLDAAISYCDVINYITSEEELMETFKHIANLLKEGGLFIFDVHSLTYVQECLVNQTFADVTDNASYIWDCFQGESTGEMFHELTFFAKEEDGKYKRFDEVHHQRTYSASSYKTLLKDVGFKNIVLYSDFSLKMEILPETTDRIFFVAEK